MRFKFLIPGEILLKDLSFNSLYEIQTAVKLFNENPAFNFQFSLWDSLIVVKFVSSCWNLITFNSLYEIQKYVAQASSGQPCAFNSLYEIQMKLKPFWKTRICSFNSLYEIPSSRIPPFFPHKHFQFSLWDSGEPACKQSKMLTFQFSLWDSIYTGGVLMKNREYRLSILFMRFHQKSLQEYQDNEYTFNSLYEIQYFLEEYIRITTKIFQFSLWDSKRKESKDSKEKYLTFNSLYEILILMVFIYKLLHTDHFQFSLWDS